MEKMLTLKTNITMYKMQMMKMIEMMKIGDKDDMTKILVVENMTVLKEIQGYMISMARVFCTL